jgi:ABC-type uncharacterized transport system substrate-binding protein
VRVTPRGAAGVRRRRLAAWLLAGLVPATPAAAHPHVFVDYGVVLMFNAEGISGIEVSWAFDEMTSSLLLAGTGAGGGHALSAAEARAIEQRHFQPLRSSRYFMDVRVDGRPARVDAARDFRVAVARDRVTYTFTLPVSGGSGREGTLELRIDDPAYYVAFDPRPDTPLRWSAPPGLAVQCRVVPSSGSYEAAAIRCKYRRRTP